MVLAGPDVYQINSEIYVSIGGEEECMLKKIHCPGLSLVQSMDATALVYVQFFANAGAMLWTVLRGLF